MPLQHRGAVASLTPEHPPHRHLPVARRGNPAEGTHPVRFRVADNTHVNGHNTSARTLVTAAITLTVLAASQPLATASTPAMSHSSATAVAASTNTPKPKLKYKPAKRTLVVKTRKRGAIRIVIKAVDGERSKTRVRANRRTTRFAVPPDAAVIRVRQTRPRKSAWARLVVAPGNPGTPGDPGGKDDSDGGDDGDNPGAGGSPEMNDQEYEQAVISELNKMRAKGWCGGVDYGPQRALERNAALDRAAEMDLAGAPGLPWEIAWAAGIERHIYANTIVLAGSDPLSQVSAQFDPQAPRDICELVLMPLNAHLVGVAATPWEELGETLPVRIRHVSIYTG